MVLGRATRQREKIFVAAGSSVSDPAGSANSCSTIRPKAAVSAAKTKQHYTSQRLQ
jgi:hypothetical protein